MADIFTVQIPCALCGKLHDEYCIDGHICVPHICGDCLRKTIKEWGQTPKCIKCQHCTYIHEYESYWCSKYGMSIDSDWHSGCCRYFEKYEEESQ